MPTLYFVRIQDNVKKLTELINLYLLIYKRNFDGSKRWKTKPTCKCRALFLLCVVKKKTLYNFMIIHTTWPFFETEMTNWISKNTEFKSTLLFRLVNFSKSRLIILENFKRFCFSIQSYFYSTFIFSFSNFISSSMWGSTLQMGWSRTSLQKASIL